MANTYPAAVWLNPVPEHIGAIPARSRSSAELMQDRMYPLTLAGLDEAMRTLSRKS
jgi:uncharacterized protein with von Willebrand factor type A (vWA) domain